MISANFESFYQNIKKNGINDIHFFQGSSYEFWYKTLKDCYRSFIVTEKTEPLIASIICKSN